MFSHEFTQKQLFNKVMIDTTLPNIGNRWQELNLPIAKDPKEREKIKKRIKEVFDKRWEAEEKIKALGGTTKDNVTKKTAYLVVGADPGGTKLTKAQELDTEQIDEKKLLDILEGKE